MNQKKTDLLASSEHSMTKRTVVQILVTMKSISKTFMGMQGTTVTHFPEQ